MSSFEKGGDCFPDPDAAAAAWRAGARTLTWKHDEYDPTSCKAPVGAVVYDGFTNDVLELLPTRTEVYGAKPPLYSSPPSKPPEFEPWEPRAFQRAVKAALRACESFPAPGAGRFTDDHGTVWSDVVVTCASAKSSATRLR